MSAAWQAETRSRIGTRRPGPPHVFWLFVGPFLLGLLIFTYLPIGWGLGVSFFRAYNTLTPHQFVGLENYRSLLADAQFRGSLLTGLLFALFIIPTTFAGALVLAVLVDKLPRGSGLFRSVFFVPAACSYVVGALIWRTNLFNGLSFGFVNSLLGMAGLPPQGWITTVNPPLYWVAVTTLRLWLQLGPYMIIFLAGLQEIPTVLYEAAAVDGARTGWQTFRQITWPLLRNNSLAIAMLLTIAAVQAFDEFFNLFGSSTGGGPSAGGLLARPPMIYLYFVAFRDNNFGVGAAGTFILTALLILLVVVPARWFRFGSEERG
jgi:multiple sugar transport system permease protein